MNMSPMPPSHQQFPPHGFPPQVCPPHFPPQGNNITPVPYLQSIDVIYTDKYEDKPHDAIKGYDGCEVDINKGFGGQYVWLVPRFSNDPSFAATSIEIITQKEEAPGGMDLIKGTKKLHRYLNLVYNQESSNRITEVCMMRFNNHTDIYKLPSWQFTTDLNKDRKGDYLYLAWKTGDIMTTSFPQGGHSGQVGQGGGQVGQGGHHGHHGHNHHGHGHHGY